MYNLLFIPQIKTEYAVVPIILLGVSFAEIANLLVFLWFHLRKWKTPIFSMIGIGSLFLTVSTVFYGRFILNGFLSTEKSAFDATIDAFLISFCSGMTLVCIHAVDVAIIRVFYEV
jgi:hypothetical protein